MKKAISICLILAMLISIAGMTAVAVTPTPAASVGLIFDLGIVGAQPDGFPLPGTRITTTSLINRAESDVAGTVWAGMMFDNLPPGDPNYQIRFERDEHDIPFLQWLPVQTGVSTDHRPIRVSAPNRPNHFGGMQAITISMWYQPAATTAETGLFGIARNPGGPQNSEMEVNQTASTAANLPLRVSMWGNTLAGNSQGPFMHNDAFNNNGTNVVKDFGVWRNVVITSSFAGANVPIMQVFVDGVPTTTMGGAAASRLAGDLFLYIGGSRGQANVRFNGRIADFKVWDYARSADAIVAQFDEEREIFQPDGNGPGPIRPNPANSLILDLGFTDPQTPSQRISPANLSNRAAAGLAGTVWEGLTFDNTPGTDPNYQIFFDTDENDIPFLRWPDNVPLTTVQTPIRVTAPYRPNHFGGMREITISMWYQPQRVGNAGTALAGIARAPGGPQNSEMELLQGGYTAPGNPFRLTLWGNTLAGNNTGPHLHNDAFNSNNAVVKEPGVWRNVVITSSFADEYATAPTLQMFVDGVPSDDLDGGVPAGRLVGDLFLFIGGARGIGHQRFNGRIADFKVWNYARSATDIIGQFNAERPTFQPQPASGVFVTPNANRFSFTGDSRIRADFNIGYIGEVGETGEAMVILSVVNTVENQLVDVQTFPLPSIAAGTSVTNHIQSLPLVGNIENFEARFMVWDNFRAMTPLITEAPWSHIVAGEAYVTAREGFRYLFEIPISGDVNPITLTPANFTVYDMEVTNVIYNPYSGLARVFVAAEAGETVFSLSEQVYVNADLRKTNGSGYDLSVSARIIEERIADVNSAVVLRTQTFLNGIPLFSLAGRSEVDVRLTIIDGRFSGNAPLSANVTVTTNGDETTLANVPVVITKDYVKVIYVPVEYSFTQNSVINATIN